MWFVIIDILIVLIVFVVVFVSVFIFKQIAEAWQLHKKNIERQRFNDELGELVYVSRQGEREELNRSLLNRSNTGERDYEH